jgi:hypothetical protein
MERKSLSKILQDSERSTLTQAWDDSKPAPEFTPLPNGEYVAQLVGGSACLSTIGTPGYELRFRVLEGPHAGRRVWHRLWLTPNAMPLAKRDLNKFGITNLDQLDRPLPQGYRCKLKVALRREDDGREYNRVRSFEVLGIEPPERDPFAPPEMTGGLESPQTNPAEAEKEVAA